MDCCTEKIIEIKNQMKAPNHIRDGRFFLVHCYACNQDNWLPFVAYGCCAFCNWKDTAHNPLKIIDF